MISEQGQKMLALQEKLAKIHHYTPIEPNIFDGDVREVYLKELPSWCCVDGDEKMVYTHNGGIIAKGYSRIVVGDYGAFVEFSNEEIFKGSIKIKSGQEFRINDKRFSAHCKYEWYTDKYGDGLKIYHQKKTVSYADYIVGMWYISPYELSVRC